MFLLPLIGALLFSTSTALAASPMDTVQAFCRIDGRGDRIWARTWTNVAPLVTWGLEPAWDHVLLIEGYEVGSSRYVDDENATVDVTYHIGAEVEGGEIKREAREEKRTFRLVSDENESGWYIAGPPPPPHVFLSQVEAEEMAASLAAESESFLTSAAFVQRFLNGAGWDITPFTVDTSANLGELSEVTTPAAGDIVLYYDGDAPYHIGVLESEDVVISATLNGGIRRAPTDAFAGTVRYRRARDSARVTTPTPLKAATPTPAKKKAKGKAAAKSGKNVAR